ncbi:MAG: ParA family protein [Bacteroidetes bacterium]|nr:ParA family protein [Bacteroidota bacterium]
MLSTIAFSNHKGGTGKTTSTINIAAVLRNKGKRVLVIDLDPQANLTYSLGVTGVDATVQDWLIGHSGLDECLIQTEGLSLLPASVSMVNSEDVLKKIPNYSFSLKNKLSQLDYDFVLIDCPPAIGSLTRIALTASDYVIIPMLLEILSIQGLSQIMKFIKDIKITSNPSLEILGVLGVCVNESRKLTSEVLGFIDFAYKVDVFNNRIHNNVKAAEAPSFAKSVIDYAPECTSTKDYKAVTDEILKKIEFSKTAYHIN